MTFQVAMLDYWRGIFGFTSSNYLGFWDPTLPKAEISLSSIHVEWVSMDESLLSVPILARV